MIVTNVLKIIVTGEDKASGVLSNVGSAIAGIGAVGVTAGAAAGAALLAIGVGATKLAIDAAPLADIKASFGGIAEASGTSSKAVLADFKKNTAGMLTNADAMKAYNEAAQLITPTFANQLPEAMKYLSKVSASTGEDLGYLVDSLVRGVGRESIAILDNLKIQVDREEALKRGALALGKTVDEMTKAERQEALMAVVMEKLVENTAALPDVTESANAKMKAMRATLIDVKDSIGLALQPALIAVLNPLGDLAEKYGPQVTVWAEKAGEWLGVKLPLAIEWLKGTWEGLKPTAIWLKDTFSAFSENLLPELVKAWDILKKGGEEIYELYKTELKPELDKLWKSLGLGTVSSEGVAGAFGQFLGVLTELIASGLIEVVKGGITGLVLAMEAGKVAGHAIRDAINTAKTAFNNIAGVIGHVKGLFIEFRDAVNSFQLPWWLRPGSPTPLETGLLGIGKALAEVQGLASGGLGFGMDARQVVNRTSNTSNLTMHVHTRATTETVVQGFNTMRALA